MLLAGQFGDRIPVGCDFQHPPRPPLGPPSLLYDGYWVIHEGKEAGAWRWNPPHLARRLKKEWCYTSTPTTTTCLYGLLQGELYLLVSLGLAKVYCYYMYRLNPWLLYLPSGLTLKALHFTYTAYLLCVPYEAYSKRWLLCVPYAAFKQWLFN
jgi:hypothetical protein